MTTFPKCKYCANAILPRDDDHHLSDLEQGIAWPNDMCWTCIDVEFCCNVAKDEYGTKKMALAVAKDYGLTEAYARMGGTP